VSVKIAVVGGGSTYTPELIEGFLAHRDRLPVDELVLFDIDRERLDVVGGLARRIMTKREWTGELVLTTDRDRALDGASFVIVQLRVGGQAARLVDETLPLEFGCIGQETTGPGGFAKALRTVPVVLEIAEETARRGAKDAWVVDFTNPVGIVMQALLDEGHRAIGLCNSAIGFQRQIAGLLEIAPERVALEHVGLNHLTWERAARVDGVDRLPELIAGRADTIADRIGIPADLIRLLGAIPSYYLRYFYLTDVVLREQLSGTRKSRAEEVMAIEEDLLEMYRDPALVEKPKLLEQRGGAYYSEAAAQLIASLHAGTGDDQVVDIRNDGALPDLPDDAVVEVPARIDAGGPPRTFPDALPPEMLGLVQVKAYERLIARRDRRRSRRCAEGPAREPAVGLLVATSLPEAFSRQSRASPRFSSAERPPSFRSSALPNVSFWPIVVYVFREFFLTMRRRRRRRAACGGSQHHRGNPELLRAINERTVIELMHRRGLSCSARISGLPEPTISLTLAGPSRPAWRDGRAVARRSRSERFRREQTSGGWVVGIDVTQGARRDRRHRGDDRGPPRERPRSAAKTSSGRSEAARAGERGGVQWKQVNHAVLGSPGVFDPVHGYMAMAPNLPAGPVWCAVRDELGTNVNFENDVNLRPGRARHGHGRNVKLRLPIHRHGHRMAGSTATVPGRMGRRAIAYMPLGMGDPRIREPAAALRRGGRGGGCHPNRTQARDAHAAEPGKSHRRAPWSRRARVCRRRRRARRLPRDGHAGAGPGAGDPGRSGRNGDPLEPIERGSEASFHSGPALWFRPWARTRPSRAVVTAPEAARDTWPLARQAVIRCPAARPARA
jgi:6-phospho-beta-glucosidase